MSIVRKVGAKEMDQERCAVLPGIVIAAFMLPFSILPVTGIGGDTLS